MRSSRSRLRHGTIDSLIEVNALDRCSPLLPLASLLASGFAEEENVIKEPGLDNRHRDKKSAAGTVRTLRKIYGAGFGPG